MFREGCPPRELAPCRPWLPNGTRARDLYRYGPEGAAAVAETLPVILTVPVITGAVSYVTSQTIPYGYTIRSAHFSASQPASAGSINIALALRYTQETTNDTTAWNNGFPLLSPLGNSEDIPISNSLSLAGLLIPVETTPHRIILRVTINTPVVVGATAILIIVATEDLQAWLAANPRRIGP